jgi:hypothetical protein
MKLCRMVENYDAVKTLPLRWLIVVILSYTECRGAQQRARIEKRVLDINARKQLS